LTKFLGDVTGKLEPVVNSTDRDHGDRGPGNQCLGFKISGSWESPMGDSLEHRSYLEVQVLKTGGVLEAVHMFICLPCSPKKMMHKICPIAFLRRNSGI